jgi:DNA-binding GntR family transcriptional regulator
VSDLGIRLDRQSARLLFNQLADALRTKILDGTIPPDRKLPTEEAIAKETGVGNSTAARAIGQLRKEGLVVFVPGRGSFSATADVIAKARRKR